MSKLINKTRLQQFATKLWEKIKNRYDNAFVNATITTKAETDKKIKFTKASGGTTVDIDLADYARLSDKNDFEKEVSSNIGMIDNTLKLGALNGNANSRRVSGHRNVTTKAFVDGYIDHIVVYTDPSLAVGTPTTWEVWAIKKGQNKTDDVVLKKYDKSANVEEKTFDGGSSRVVKLHIGESFNNEVYFIVCCGDNRQIKVCVVNENNKDGVVNLSSKPGNSEGSPIDWTYNADNNIAIMYLYGRESISSLSEKLKQIQANGSNYVLKSETTATGGNGEAGKVVKLDSDGKLNSNMLPSIAIGEYFEISEFTDNALQGLNHYENGDTVVVTSGADRGARYLCINKGGTGALTDAFIKLNDKAGVVTSVNEKTGAIVLGIASTTNKLQLKVNNEIKSEVDIISDDEITSIITSLS